MIKKLVKHGNSYALIIDKPILELLKIKPDTPLEISTEGKRIVISAQENDHEEKLKQFLVEVNQQYGEALKRLA